MQVAWRRSTRITNLSRCMSNAASGAYQRPLPAGKLPVYDLAIELIEKDSAAKKALSEKETDPTRRLELDIQSRINLPEVRWAFAQGKYDLSQPVYRHLLEQAWRKQGTLDLLMERVHQMKVIPDILPEFWPTVDLRLSFSQGEDVVPGIFIPVKSTLQAPSIMAQAYHPEEKLYTLLVVDPDVPDPSTQSFSTYLHALQPNIPLSATKTQIVLPTAPETSDTALAYIPPHPQHGTPYHRYTTLLLPQSSEISIEITKIPREHFDVRSFYKKYAFTSGGGIHMFREEWDETVGMVYKKLFSCPEPKFGKAPQPDPYLDGTGRRFSKYTNA